MNPQLISTIWFFARWLLLAGAVAGVYFYIVNIGVTKEENKGLKEDKKVLEQQIEVKDEVQKTINKVVVDKEYRQKVRDRYEAR